MEHPLDRWEELHEYCSQSYDPETKESSFTFHRCRVWKEDARGISQFESADPVFTVTIGMDGILQKEV